tara:strand:- start:69 stop:452 length:384 start_codon:yes stop_codon:yes gene_type:complete
MPKKFRTQHDTNRQASNSDDLINPHIQVNNWGCNSSAAEAYKEHCFESLSLFDALIEEGVCKEQARGILPQTMYTEYYATANLSNVLKFIDLRMHEGAQWEIQRLAVCMLNIIKEIWPITVESYINK